MKQRYSGAAGGVGAASEWSGKGSTGSGQIVESSPPWRIKVQTTFMTPFEAKNLNDFTLEPEGTGTRVMVDAGSNLYFMTLIGLFMNMDRLTGKRFETGLSNLKRLAETE